MRMFVPNLEQQNKWIHISFPPLSNILISIVNLEKSQMCVNRIN
jgi:hypothetical protein